MLCLDTVQRIESYNSSFPQFPDSHLYRNQNLVQGVWFFGNNYKGSGYYGAYPPAYLSRMKAVFPDADRVLHLFSGSLPESDDYIRYDMNPTLFPDVCGEFKLDGDTMVPTTSVGDHFLPQSFEVIYADPPYSAQDAKNYKTTMISRIKTLRECWHLLVPGGFVAWMDTNWPMFSKDQFSLWGALGLFRSTNHRVRGVFIFQKVGGAE